MKSELQKRVATGFAGALLLIALIAYGKWLGIFLILSVISLGMIFEFSEITFTMTDRIEKRYLLLSLTWFILLTNLIIPSFEIHLLILSFSVLFSYFLWSAKKHTDQQFNLHFRELMFSVFALVYLVFIPPYFMKIYDIGGVAWVILFLFIVWIGDTAAYFVGKRFGKKKLYPLISPKKTVEGALGGLGAGVLLTLGFKVLYLPRLSWLGALLLPIFVGIVAQIGDLCESFFKRAFDKKDSGSVLPGHGGFLDRFDGVVFSLPVMYICLRIFG